MTFSKIDEEHLFLSGQQADVFEMSCDLGLDSGKFISAFMESGTAAKYDLPRHRIRWAGERHLLERFLSEKNIPQGETWRKDTMSWIGYTYRYWHFLTKQSSREIARIADGERMRALWPALHMDSVESAVHAILEGKFLQARKAAARKAHPIAHR